MALHKLNVLHWHLTDDQAWRIEIRKYPRLTEVGAWRAPRRAAGRQVRPRYGGFYTQDQVREIVAYAQARHITIVPEIEMPGHATAAIAAYPDWDTVADPPTSPPRGLGRAARPLQSRRADHLGDAGRADRGDGPVPRAATSTSAATRR